MSWIGVVGNVFGVCVNVLSRVKKKLDLPVNSSKHYSIRFCLILSVKENNNNKEMHMEASIYEHHDDLIH